MASSRVLAALCLALVLAPAAMAESSVVQQLQSSQFTGFMKLLEHADLIPELEAAEKAGKGLTIFCPTDDALMYHTSPTLLAFLKTKENKATLRKVLLNHVVVERLSPFQWEGAKKTLDGSRLQLSMDAQAFYAGNVAVMQYNALVAGGAAVHSIPTLILPAGLSTAAGNVEMFVEEGTEVRRMLAAGAPAPGPAYQPPSPPAPKGAASLVASGFTVAAALVAAVLAF